MKNSHRISFAIVGLLCALLVADAVWAAAPSVIEAAKAEGEMIWAGGGSAEIDENMNRAFMKKYPFIQAKKTRVQSQRLLVRFETESRAGKHTFDIVRTTDWYIDIFKKKGLLLKYEPPERKNIPDEFKDRDGFYTSLYTAVHAPAYNTRMVAKSDLPRSYDDLLDPKWKGKLGLEDAAYVWFVNVLKIKGEKAGLEYMRRLARQDVSLRASTTLLANLVTAGEIPLAIDLYADDIERQKKAGAPIKWIALDPTIVHTIAGAVNKNAPHPNAARLFMDFLLSEEGQRVYLSNNLQPTRKGLITPWAPKGKLHVNDPEIGEKVSEYQKMFSEIFGGK
ncbi:MAG: extracellular solute-binding protein [Deltaproteobacteria bacterium]|nr:extracellular solute-binding protein [Deltaproteobacteria bacterium]